MSDHPFVYATYFYRTPPAFRMFVRGWTFERLQAEKAAAQKLLPAEYMAQYAEEYLYRLESESRGAWAE